MQRSRPAPRPTERRARRPRIPSLRRPGCSPPMRMARPESYLSDGVVLESTQELHQQEGVSLHTFGLFQEVFVWLSAKDISDDERYSISIEWAELDVVGAAVDQLGLRLSYGCDALVWAKGEDPRDGQRGEPWSELPYGHGATRARPVEIVEADQEG